MNRRREIHWGEAWPGGGRKEREGQCHAADLGLYFQGDKRSIADWLMGVINSRESQVCGNLTALPELSNY